MNPENDANPQYRLLVYKLHTKGYYAGKEVKPLDIQWADNARTKPFLYNTMECYGPYDRLREAKAQYTREVGWSHNAEHVLGVIQISEPQVWNNSTIAGEK
jgi:hypothetical protein